MGHCLLKRLCACAIVIAVASSYIALSGASGSAQGADPKTEVALAIAHDVLAELGITQPAGQPVGNSIKAMALSAVNMAVSSSGKGTATYTGTIAFLVDQEMLRQSMNAYAAKAAIELPGSPDAALKAGNLDEQLDNLDRRQRLRPWQYLAVGATGASAGIAARHTAPRAVAAGLGISSATYIQLDRKNNRFRLNLPSTMFKSTLDPHEGARLGQIKLSALAPCTRFVPAVRAREINPTLNTYHETLDFRCGNSSALGTYMGAIPLNLIPTIQRHPRYLDFIPDSLAVRDLQRLSGNSDSDADPISMIWEDPDFALATLLNSDRSFAQSVSDIIAHSKTLAKDSGYLFPPPPNYTVTDPFAGDSTFASSVGDILPQASFARLASSLTSPTSTYIVQAANVRYANSISGAVNNMPDRVAYSCPTYQYDINGNLVYAGPGTCYQDNHIKGANQNAIASTIAGAQQYMAGNSTYDFSTARCSTVNAVKRARIFFNDALTQYLSYYEFLTSSGTICTYAFVNTLTLDDTLKGDLAEALRSDPSFVSRNGLDLNGVSVGAPDVFVSALEGPTVRIAGRAAIEELLRSSDLAGDVYQQPGWLGTSGITIDRSLIRESAKTDVYETKAFFFEQLSRFTSQGGAVRGTYVPDLANHIMAAYDAAQRQAFASADQLSSDTNSKLQQANNQWSIGVSLTVGGPIPVVGSFTVQVGQVSVSAGIGTGPAGAAVAIVGGSLFGIPIPSRPISIVPPSVGGSEGDVPGSFSTFAQAASAGRGLGVPSDAGLPNVVATIPIFSQPISVLPPPWSGATTSATVPNGAVPIGGIPAIGPVAPDGVPTPLVDSAYYGAAVAPTAAIAAALASVGAGRKLTPGEFQALAAAERAARVQEGSSNRSLVTAPSNNMISARRPGRGCTYCADLTSPSDVMTSLGDINAKELRTFTNDLASAQRQNKRLADTLPSVHLTSGNGGRFIQVRYTYFFRGGGQISLLRFYELPGAFQAIYLQDGKSLELAYWAGALLEQAVNDGKISLPLEQLQAAIAPYKGDIEQRLKRLQDGTLDPATRMFLATMSADMIAYWSQAVSGQGKTAIVPPGLGGAMIALIPTPAMIFEDRAAIAGEQIGAELAGPLAQDVHFGQYGVDSAGIPHENTVGGRFNKGQALARIAINEAPGGRPNMLPYKDTAIPPKRSIGFGYNLDKPEAAAEVQTILKRSLADVLKRGLLNEEEAEKLLSAETDDAVAKAKRLFPNFDSLGAPRQFVLVDMTYNLWNKVDDFADFIAAVKAGNFNAAADEMQKSKWYGQVGLRGVIDTDIMRRGGWAPAPPIGKVPPQ